MNKFQPFQASIGGSDRIYYKHAVFPMGTYSTEYEFTQVTFKYGSMPMVFSGCDFEKVVFNSVDLRFAVFINCKFNRCNFQRCLMDYSSFIECTGHDISFRQCVAEDMLVMHAMFDGTLFSNCKLNRLRLSVNTEYLAPLVFVGCALDDANIENLGSLQYAEVFGTPAISAQDKLSVKTEKCAGKFNIRGFKYGQPNS